MWKGEAKSPIGAEPQQCRFTDRPKFCRSNPHVRAVPSAYCTAANGYQGVCVVENSAQGQSTLRFSHGLHTLIVQPSQLIPNAVAGYSRWVIKNRSIEWRTYFRSTVYCLQQAMHVRSRKAVGAKDVCHVDQICRAVYASENEEG